MKRNKKYFGNAVQAIFNTAIEKYCVNGDESIATIVNLLNVAYDMAFMWNLWEIIKICGVCNKINKLLVNDNSDYRILEEKNTYKLVKLE